MSQVTISGAVSGLDTASLINQLVSVQTNQQSLLRSQQTAVQQRATAYGSLSTALNSLSTLSTELAKTSAWKGATATSSTSSVTASVTATTNGSITFDVTGVAKAHSLVTTSSLSGTGDVAATGAITINGPGGAVTTLTDLGGGTLAEVVSKINESDSGVKAAAVRTGPGAYRLQLTSSTTGADSAFTVEGLDGFDSTAVLTQGSDAQLTFGAGSPAAYTVTSNTNTFGDLVPGLSFTVSKQETNVTVSARADGSAVADKVNQLVSQVNGILTDISSKTAYNSSTKSAGVFAGDSAVRALQQNLLSSVGVTGAPGVRLTREGRLSFDRQAFLDAFAADPAKVAQSFGAKLTLNPVDGLSGTSVELSNALKSARAGTYAVQVDRAPGREQWSIETGGDTAGKVLNVTRGATTVTYTAEAEDTLSDVAAAFNSRSATARFGVTARVDGTALVFTADAAGTSRAFTAQIDGFASTQLVAGADVSGSIDGQTATGAGSVLALPTGTGGAVGLSLEITTTDTDLAATAGAIGTVRFTPGLASRLVTLISDATGSTGSITTATSGANSQIKRFQSQIDAWDARLTAYRKALTRQFTAMETALAQLKTQTSALSNLVNSSTTSTGTASSSS
jgi:flagellar hook-associated protein 2